MDALESCCFSVVRRCSQLSIGWGENPGELAWQQLLSRCSLMIPNATCIVIGPTFNLRGLYIRVISDAPDPGKTLFPAFTRPVLHLLAPPSRGSASSLFLSHPSRVCAIIQKPATSLQQSVSPASLLPFAPSTSHPRCAMPPRT